ncbi:MAG TPA: cytochrome P460 family protein [Terriglobia bacterium]|nr:cytochrome P460 family protein [Terriglobia bacterium]
MIEKGFAKTACLSILSAAMGIVGIFTVVAGQDRDFRDPEFTEKNQLIRPKNYREWIFVSSGLGMSYTQTTPTDGHRPSFDNVFVEPSAYRTFLRTGRWPDKTIFVLEVRSSSSHGSINLAGSFQDALVGVEAEVKDESRFPEKWAYFSFDENGRLKDTATALPKESCFSCHHTNGAVENTFTQFYPTLHPVAISKGTLNPGYKPDTSQK